MHRTAELALLIAFLAVATLVLMLLLSSSLGIPQVSGHVFPAGQVARATR